MHNIYNIDLYIARGLTQENPVSWELGTAKSLTETHFSNTNTIIALTLAIFRCDTMAIEKYTGTEFIANERRKIPYKKTN